VSGVLAITITMAQDMNKIIRTPNNFCLLDVIVEDGQKTAMTYVFSNNSSWYIYNIYILV